MLGFLLSLFLIGIVAGYLARLLVMGPDPIGFWRTVVLGIVGSFVGGTIGVLLFTGKLVFSFGPVLLAVPGAVLALLIYRKVKFGSIMPPRDVLRSGRRR